MFIKPHQRAAQAMTRPLAMRLLLVMTLLAWPLPSSMAQAQSSSSVWLVSKGDNQLYMGGTLHLLSARDYPLPVPFDVAFAAADTLVFETDIGALDSAQVQARLQSMVMLPAGTTLQASLSAQTYEALRAYLAATGMDVRAFNQIKPAMVAMVISVLELQRLGLGEAGVDEHYYRQGSLEGKSIGWLESLDEHLAYVASMGEGYEDDFLRYTLDDMENVEPMVDSMVASWRFGDMAALDEHTVQPMREVFPSVYATLLVERNHNWLPQIERMLVTPEVELLLVGVAHLAGEDGVLQMLRHKGYRVEQLVPP